MRTFMQAVHQRALARSMRLGRRLAREEDGATAIEFAAVGIPFFMMLFGILGVGLYFFSIFNLENAVEQASRPLRTGEWEKLYPVTDAASVAAGRTAFSKAVCDQLAPFFDCQNKLRVQVVNVTVAGTVPSAGACLGKDPLGADILIPTANTRYEDIKATQTVVVTVCYELDLLQSIPFIKLGNMPSGATMLQASTAFKTEPY
jgi:Flp pilus assembly protein TadG